MTISPTPPTARLLCITRVMTAGLAALAVGGGTVIMVMPHGRDAGLRVAMGGWFVLLGAGMGLWAWRGNWNPLDTEHHARQAALVRRAESIGGATELFLLALILLGLMFPKSFDDRFTNHRWFVYLAAMGIAASAITRAVRRVQARRAAALNAREVSR